MLGLACILSISGVGVALETTAYAAAVPQAVYNGWEQKSDGMHYYQFGKELKDTGIKIDGYQQDGGWCLQ